MAAADSAGIGSPAGSAVAPPGAHHDDAGRSVVQTAAVETVRGELARVDAKAVLLLALAGGGLAVAATVLPGAAAPGAARAVGWAAAAACAAAVGLLLWAVRPALHSSPGSWVEHARRAGRQDRPTALRGWAYSDELAYLAAVALAKYRRVRAAVDLLLAGLVLAAAAAGLAGLT
jgi:hypothetical protein